MAFGVVTEGSLQVEHGNVKLLGLMPWLSPYCLANGFLALSACAYLAAVYLTNETDGDLREDFRWRAILAGTTTAILAGLVLLLAGLQAHWFFHRLMSLRTLPVVLAGLVCFAGSAWSVFTRRFSLSRVFAASQIALLILGWGLAQYPYLVYPDLPLDAIAAPVGTLRFVVWSLPVGGILIIPSLWMLFLVFKSH
jgi:cytochrome d ubiquinol oxidase subunit II